LAWPPDGPAGLGGRASLSALIPFGLRSAQSLTDGRPRLVTPARLLTRVRCTKGRRPAPFGQPGHLSSRPVRGLVSPDSPQPFREDAHMSRRTHSGPSPNSRLAARLRLEVLEDRLALSASPTIDLSRLSVGGNYAGDYVPVQHRDGAPPSALSVSSLAGEVGLVKTLSKVNLSPSFSVAAALAAYKADRRIQLAEPDYTLKVSAIPNDPRFSEQWALN